MCHGQSKVVRLQRVLASKEKAENKFKFPSLTSISNSKQNSPPKKQKQNHFWLMEYLDITSGSHNLHQFKLLFRFYYKGLGFATLLSFYCSKSLQLSNSQISDTPLFLWRNRQLAHEQKWECRTHGLLFVGGFEKPCWELRPL
jgi:hypothetical protein